MWLFTTLGFFSCTRSKDDPTMMQIRARERVDLENLCSVIGLSADILETPAADYRYRVIVMPEVFLTVLTEIGKRIKYSNFKDAVHDKPDQASKGTAYLRVWSIMAGLQPGYGEQLPRVGLDFFRGLGEGNEPAGDPNPYTCGHCDFDEAEGDLIARCDKCQAAFKAATVAAASEDGKPTYRQQREGELNEGDTVSLNRASGRHTFRFVLEQDPTSPYDIPIASTPNETVKRLIERAAAMGIEIPAGSIVAVDDGPPAPDLTRALSNPKQVRPGKADKKNSNLVEQQKAGRKLRKKGDQ